MAEISPPGWMQAGSYAARTDRLSAITAMLGYSGYSVDESAPLRPRQGVRPSYQNYQLKARAAGTPNMTVIVSAGVAWVDNHDINGYGTYPLINDADVTLNIAPAGGAGQYRKDTVVFSVYDAETAGSLNLAHLEVIQGPYASSAGATVRGTLPPNCTTICDIAIAPSQSSISAANITDIRLFTSALGGIASIPSTIAQNHMHPGQVTYEPDLDDFLVGTLAGTSRKLREVIRPSISLQAASPPFNTTGTYVDYLAASWPPITVTVPSSGMVRVVIGADLSNTNSSASTCHAGWRASGAAIVAPGSDHNVIAAGVRIAASRERTLTGLPAGQALTITPVWNISSGSSGTALTQGGVLEVTPLP